MTLKHNKKRNSGMIGDFFSAYIAENVVNKNYNNIVSAREIWNKFANPKTELYKEIQLHENIRNCNLKNESVIDVFVSLIKRKAVSSIDVKKLDEEKTCLIRAINENLKDEKFFFRPIKNYTELATIQVWLNLCSSRKTLTEGFVNPAYSELEDIVYEIIKSKKLYENSSNNPSLTKEKLNEVLSLGEGDVDRLVVNIMREKFNKKLNEQFNDYQKSILQQYVFSTEHEPKKLLNTLSLLREETISLIEKEMAENKRVSKSEKDKHGEILAVLKEETENAKKPLYSIDDNKIAFYMSVSKLNDELKE
jgi:hypothetical protein